MYIKQSVCVVLLLFLTFFLLSGGKAQEVLSRDPSAALHRGIHELTLNTAGDVGNPYYDIPFKITFTRPDGSKVVADGFFDGGASFKARAYCDVPGIWQWTSSSNHPGLDRKSGSFEVVPSDLKGKLRIHPDDPYQFAYDNGDWFLHIGDTGYRFVVASEPYWQEYIDQAAEMADQAQAKKWINMADEVLSSWLSYGYDVSANRYYGMLHMETGEPILREEGDDYPYKPGNYSDIWVPLFPTHNYPMSLAESSLKLYQLTQKEIYRQSCERWVEVIKASLPARQGNGAYAEHYGRVIHFLLSCAETLNDNTYKNLADKVAKEAVDVLFAHDMFRSHPGEYRYDAVDGVGILSLSLIWLETGKEPDRMGLFF